jgi:hypothetical protein
VEQAARDGGFRVPPQLTYPLSHPAGRTIHRQAMNLFESQKDAICQGDLNLHLLSCAGSRRTEVVAPNVAIILTTGFRPSNTVAFTLTNKAAAEFKECIISRCQEATGESYGMAEMHIANIYGFCFDLLTAEVPKYLKFDVLDEVLQALFIDRQGKKNNLTASTDPARQPLKRYKAPSHYLRAIGIHREVDTHTQALKNSSGEAMAVCDRRVGHLNLAHPGAMLMKKPLSCVLFMLLMLAPTTTWAQGATTKVRSAKSLPATCTPGGANTPADTIIVNNIHYVCTGPNTWSIPPYADVTAFGARAPVGGTPNGTATCTSGSNQIGAVSTFAWEQAGGTWPGDGITLYGCGPTETMSTPSGLSVTPAGMWGPPETQAPITTVASGRSTYSYTVIAADIHGGLTLPETPVTITTGFASLGKQTATINTLSRTNDQVTVTLTSAPASPLVVGELVEIEPTNSAQFYGWFNVAQVDSSTQFEIWNTSTDTRAQGWMLGDTTSYSGGGSVVFYRNNYLKWTPVTGAWKYYVCGKRPRDTNYHLIGQTRPTGISNGYLDASFEDYGSPYMDLQSYPIYVQTAAEATYNNATNIANQTTSNAICTATKTLNDELSTTILSSSNGGETIVLADNASQTVSSGGVVWYWDDAPGFRKALAAAAYKSPNYFGGTVYIPPALYAYQINSYVAIPAQVTILQSGKLNLNETISVASSVNWIGEWGNIGTAQFATNNGASIGAVNAIPGLYLYGTGIALRGLVITQNISNGAVPIVDDASPTTFDNVTFSTGVSSTDYLGIAFILRGTGSIEQAFFRNASFLTGPDQTTDKSWTPSFWMAPGQNSANVGIEVTMNNINWNRRGIVLGGGGNTGRYGTTGSCPAANFDVTYSYRQGGITPMISQMSCPAYMLVTLNDVYQDTEGEPLLSNFRSNPQTNAPGAKLIARNVSGGAGNPLISGMRSSIANIESNFSNAYQFPNRDFMYDEGGFLNMVNSPYATSGTYAALTTPLRTIGIPMHGSGGYSWWFDLGRPTGVTATAVAHTGGLPAATWVYAISAVGADGGETILSLPSISVTTTTANSQVNIAWNLSVGGVAYNVWRCNTTNACVSSSGAILTSSGPWLRVALHVPGANYADIINAPNQFVLPGATGTGSTILNNSLVRAPTVAGDTVTSGNSNAFGSSASSTSSGCETNYGATTLSTGATTTNTGLNCLPANSVIDAVVYRITQTITTATSFTIGDNTTANRFCTTQSTLTVTTTGICIAQTGSSDALQTSATSVRVTASAKPGAGAIRLIVYYHTWIPPVN